MLWAASAGLAVTFIPVLMNKYLIRGRIPAEQKNPLNRWLSAALPPFTQCGIAFSPESPLYFPLWFFVASLWPLQHLGTEFMPPLDEGDLLYMPTALPGLSVSKAAQLLQQTDRLIKTVPEVASVSRKSGPEQILQRIPAPLVMFETTIQFKPKSEWRSGMTAEKIIEELDRTVRGAGPDEYLDPSDP